MFRKSNKPKRKRTAAHNIADDFEREKHKKELEKFLKQLNEDGTPKKPLTDSQIMSIVRGAIREKWMYAPNKLAYLNQHIIPDDDPNTRQRWKVQCEYCNKWFKKSDVQVDHCKGEHSLKTPEDLFQFYDSICNIGFDDMKVTCVPCHELKTAMERYNLTEEEAIIFKKVTAWKSDYPKANDQKKWLTSHGYKGEALKNAETREAAILGYFQKENK